MQRRRESKRHTLVTFWIYYAKHHWPASLEKPTQKSERKRTYPIIISSGSPFKPVIVVREPTGSPTASIVLDFCSKFYRLYS